MCYNNCRYWKNSANPDTLGWCCKKRNPCPEEFEELEETEEDGDSDFALEDWEAEEDYLRDLAEEEERLIESSGDLGNWLPRKA